MDADDQRIAADLAWQYLPGARSETYFFSYADDLNWSPPGQLDMSSQRVSFEVMDAADISGVEHTGLQGKAGRFQGESNQLHACLWQLLCT